MFLNGVKLRTAEKFESCNSLIKEIEFINVTKVKHIHTKQVYTWYVKGLNLPLKVMIFWNLNANASTWEKSPNFFITVLFCTFFKM